MNNNHNSRFFDGFLLGVVVGAIAVYLFGTKSGKNLVKIVSERGLDGLKDIIEEYNSEDLGEEQDLAGDIKKDVKEKIEEVKTIAQEKVQEAVSNVVEEEKPPKKRFFKRYKN